jgi:hypothetical protein
MNNTPVHPGDPIIGRPLNEYGVVIEDRCDTKPRKK